MFIALRDLAFARGRFALLGGVIALMTFMVVLLSALTAGLGAASVSAVDRLPVDHLALQAPASGQDVSFSTSRLPAHSVSRLAGRPGVSAAYPLGVAASRLSRGSSTEAVSLIGTDPDLLPPREAGDPIRAGEVAVTEALADATGVGPGDTVTVGGRSLHVAAVVEDTTFNHLPVAYTTIDTWRQLTHQRGVTAVGLRGDATAGTGALPSGTQVQIVTKQGAFDAVGGYRSEQGSLNLMRGLLIAVSVLVVGSFFTVWTMQRAGDLAVVRALGGSRGYLLRDALGQAVLVLLAGAVVGAAAAVAAGLVASGAVPITLTPATIGVPVAAMVAVGLLGAAVAVRRVVSVDPLTALGAAR